MRLSRNSDYSLRILIFLSLHDRLIKTSEIAAAYTVSRGHLKQPRNSSALAKVVRRVEDTLALADCFPGPGIAARPCVLDGPCQLKAALNAALEAFLRTLNQYTVADLAASPALPVHLRLRSPARPVD